jgi:hypothetical protein
MASSANAVATVPDPDQGFVNLSHFASVPGSDMIKKSYPPLVGRVVQPLRVSFDLASLSRKMSQSFLYFHAPVSQPGCVSWLDISLHRSRLLFLIKIKSTINQLISVYGLWRGGIVI